MPSRKNERKERKEHKDHCHKKHKDCPPPLIPQPIALQPWTQDDFKLNTLFKDGTDFVNKSYIHLSDLAINGDVYKIADQFVPPGTERTTLYPPPYYPRLAKPYFVGPNPGVPGPYPYEWSWDQWGGDDTLEFGKDFYSGILLHFGHTHILNMHTKFGILTQNPEADTTSQDLMMAHLINGSTQIFKKYAGLIDVAGNPITYSKPGQQQLAGLMTELITSTTPIDPNMILGALGQFASMVPPTYQSKLLAIKDQLGAYLNSVLRLKSTDPDAPPIELLSWFQLMTVHQMTIDMLWAAFRKVYTSKCKNQDDIDTANMHALVLSNEGSQFAAFFGTFYSVVSFLDIFLTAIGNTKTPLCIPDQYREVRTQWVHDGLFRWWREHVTMFIDYNKAAALQDQQIMFDTTVNMLESCSIVGVIIGEVFRAFDVLIRVRDLYGSI